MTELPKKVYVQPDYGRDYSSAKAVAADWAANQDFLIRGTSTYINKQDADHHGVTVVVAYRHLQHSITIKPEETP